MMKYSVRARHNDRLLREFTNLVCAKIWCESLSCDAYIMRWKVLYRNYDPSINR